MGSSVKGINMKYHKYAQFFPLMEGEEFNELVEDIRQNGLREPIITYEGKILDGRNRYRACKKAGVDPRFKEKKRDGALAYVVSMNIHRRHLNPSQRAVIALDVLPQLEKEAAARKRNSRSLETAVSRGKATQHAAEMFRISGKTVGRAKKVQQEAPSRLADIRAGRATVREVEREIRQRKAKQSAHKAHAQADAKKRQTQDREVKVYLDAVSDYRAALREAIKVAKFGKFSPEAQRFVLKRHEELCELMERMEAEFDG